MQEQVPHIATADCIERYLDADAQAEIRANHEQACRELHERCLGLARRRGELDADEADALCEAYELQVWRQYAMPTLEAYLEHVLGYTPRMAEERMRVARELQDLPHTRATLRAGWAWTKVREVTRVATRDTELAWLDATRDLNCRQIENLVKGHKKGDLPTDPTRPELRKERIVLELTPEAYAAYRQSAAALSDECGERLDDDMVIKLMARRALEPVTGDAPMSSACRPAAQIAYVVCRVCGGATADGAGIVVDVESAMLERAKCDAEDIGDLDAEVPARVNSTVTPRTRRQVFARDRHKCAVPTCRAARCLDIHHLLELMYGGLNKMTNLVTLCYAHHTLYHQGKLEISGAAPNLTFRRVLDGGDRVEELGDYDLSEVWPLPEDSGPDPRGCDCDSYSASAGGRMSEVVTR